jgi:dTMP kinase
VREINAFAIQGLRPDRTLLLVIDPRDGQARSQARGGPPDRLENEQREFFDRTADAYQTLADRDPERIRTIDASQPPADVLKTAIAAISDLL